MYWLQDKKDLWASRLKFLARTNYLPLNERLFRRSRIRSLLTYFCYGCCFLAILKMKDNFWLENNTNLVRVRRTELKYLQWFSDCVFLGRISATMWKKHFPNLMGEIPNSMVIKLFVKLVNKSFFKWN
jgi:hypothetical protein